MTYYLTAGRLGIATERTPVRDNGKVILTFKGEYADSVSLGGCFYPIINGRAEVPTEAIAAETPVTAHATPSHRRYVCEPLGRVGEGGLVIAPLEAPGEQLAKLAELLSQLHSRLAEAEARLEAHELAIHRKPITFGGML